MVECIESIRPQLEGVFLVNGKVLMDRRVRIEEVRSKNCIPSDIADLVQTGPSEYSTVIYILRLVEHQAVPRNARHVGVKSTSITVDAARCAGGNLLATC